jgi:hypothetical protein
MRCWVALLASTAFACGGKTDDSSRAIEPGGPNPAPTETPAPTGEPPAATPPPTGTTLPPTGTTLPPTPPPTGTTPPPIVVWYGPDAGGPVPANDAGLVPPLWSPNPGGTIKFEPTLVDVTRYSNVCGVMNPPFMNGDLYSLDIVDQTGPTPYNALSLSFSSPAPDTGVPLMLTVQPFTPQAGGNGSTWYAAQNAEGSGISFQYSQGANPSEIDTGAFDAVTVAILAMPADNGQPLTVRIQMHFVDGKTLDETFSNALSTAYSGCPAG